MVWNEPIKKTLSRPVGWLDTVLACEIQISQTSLFSIWKDLNLYLWHPYCCKTMCLNPVSGNIMTLPASQIPILYVYFTMIETTSLTNIWFFLCILNQNLRLYINISSNIHINISKLDVLGKKSPMDLRLFSRWCGPVDVFIGFFSPLGFRDNTVEKQMK